MRTRTRLTTVGVTATLALGLSVTAVHAVTDPLPIGPGATFSGVVNGDASNGVIKVVCPGPIVLGETGHPASGQYLEVVTAPATSAAPGFTGTAADSIDAYILTPTSASAGPVVVFNAFYVEEPIPTSIELPCSGDGSATFVPAPTSPTARSATVALSFEDIGL